MNLEKNINLIKLYDLYGNLLTDKQKQVFELYAIKDLSLKEVAEIQKITRQAVKFALDSVEKSLNYYEEILWIKQKFDRIKTELEELKNETNKDKINNILEEL